MQRFNNLLVGIDFSQVVDPEKPTFKPPVEHAIERSIWLAQHCSAKVTFLAAIELAGGFRTLLSSSESERLQKQADDTTRAALDKLVDRARIAGVQAEPLLVHGKGWLEITHEAMRGEHDLVIVGTRDVGTMNRLLFGTTAMNLLRQCPGPVWVVKPKPEVDVRNVLVAVDVGTMCPRVIEMGLALRSLGVQRLHFLHVVDFPLDRLWTTGVPTADSDRYHKQISDRAETFLSDELHRQLGETIPGDIEVHVKDGSIIPEPVILQYIEDQQIDLLVIGTVAGDREPGLVLGSTAERLLRQVPCSLVAVKPPGLPAAAPLE